MALHPVRLVTLHLLHHHKVIKVAILVVLVVVDMVRVAVERVLLVATPHKLADQLLAAMGLLLLFPVLL